MIRTSHPSDWLPIRRLLAETPSAAQWSAPPDASILLAEEEGRLLGMVAIRIVSDEAEILNLAVAAACRRRGWGSRLLDAALGQARGAGVRRVFLEVRESNEAARSFYARMNFAEMSRRRGYYRQPDEDALILARGL